MKVVVALITFLLSATAAQAGQIVNLNDHEIELWVSDTGAPPYPITIGAGHSWYYYSSVVKVSTSPEGDTTRMNVEHKWSIRDGKFTLQRRNMLRYD